MFVITTVILAKYVKEALSRTVNNITNFNEFNYKNKNISDILYNAAGE